MAFESLRRCSSVLRSSFAAGARAATGLAGAGGCDFGAAAAGLAGAFDAGAAGVAGAGEVALA